MSTTQHTFVFADVAGYTLLASERGDEVAADVACTLLATARRVASAHGLEVVKACGDGVLLRGADPRAALVAGLDLHAALGRDPAFPALRTGMHRGTAVRRGDDWFGAAVCVAARVTALAEPGEVVCTLEVLAGAGHLAGLRAEPRGEHELRHCPEPRAIFAVAPAPRATPTPAAALTAH